MRRYRAPDRVVDGLYPLVLHRVRHLLVHGKLAVHIVHEMLLPRTRRQSFRAQRVVDFVSVVEYGEVLLPLPLCLLLLTFVLLPLVFHLPVPVVP